VSINIKKCLNLIGSFFVTGSIVNDVVVFDDYPWITYAKIMFFLGALFFITAGVKKNKISEVEIVVLLYSTLLILTNLIFSTSGFTDRSVALTMSLLMGLISFILIVRSTVDYRDLLWSFLFWVSLSVFIGFFQVANGKLFFTDRLFFSTLIPSFYRASGFMNDPNYFSLICLLGFCFSRFLSGRFVLMCKVLSIIGVFLSGSRSGLIVLILIIVVANLRDLLSIKRILLLVIIFLFIVLNSYFLKEYLPDSISMIFESGSYDGSVERNSLADRMAAINVGIDAFHDSPLFGYGLGNLVNHPANVHAQVSHNTFIELLAENGIFGFVLYISVFLSLVSLTVRTLKFHSIKVIDAVIVTLVAFNLISFVLVTHYSRIMFFILAALVVTVKGVYKYHRNL
jgi:O-antigen ligase